MANWWYRVCIMILTLFVLSNSMAQKTVVLPADTISKDSLAAIHAVSIQTAIDNFANDPVFSHAGIGFLAMDVSTGDIVGYKNPGLCLSPASIVKLFTTATAFQVLGKDYAPKTRIYTDGTLDASGTLNGNLWIRGGGDVSLGSRYYNEDGIEDTFLRLWADTLLKMGIKFINGAVITDASEFGYQAIPDGWNWGDMGNYYGAGPSGLPIYDNVLKYVFKTGAAGTRSELTGTIPTIPGMTFQNYITAGGSGDNSYVYGAPYSLDRFGTGTLAPKVNRYVVRGSLPDPELQFAQEFHQILKMKGIGVRDSIKTARTLPPEAAATRYAGMKLFLEYKGRTMGSIGWWTNMKSVNLFAEELLCWIGYHVSGVGTTENGLNRLEYYWTGKIPVSGMFIRDGSGLSRNNAISPQHFCSLLKYMSTSKNFDAFYGTLPVAGISGTLSTVCKNQPGQGKVHAKSGTMNRVKSYAGYVETASGKRLAFTIIANNFDCSSSSAVDRMERVFNAMALF